MALYQKKNSKVWYYSVYVSGCERRLRGSCGTENKAEAELVEHTIRLAAGRKSPKEKILKLIEALYADDRNEDKIPIGAIEFEYRRLATSVGRLPSESAMKTKRHSVNKFISWQQTQWPSLEDIRDVSKACCQAFARHLEKCSLASKSRRNILGDLSSVWNLLKRGHEGIDNPWQLTMPVLTNEGRGQAFSHSQAMAIFAEGDKQGHGWGLASRIAACTGLRMGDVLTLRHEDIIDGVIHAKPSKTKRHSITVAIPLPQELLTLIGEGRGFIIPELAHAYKPSRMMPNPFSDVLSAVGIDTEAYTFHSWRHYFRTALSQAGVDASIAKRLGGWTQDATAARYDHDDHIEESRQAIDAAWKRITPCQ